MVENDEPPVLVNRSGGVHTSNKPQHVAVQTSAILLHELDKVPGEGSSVKMVQFAIPLYKNSVNFFIRVFLWLYYRRISGDFQGGCYLNPFRHVINFTACR